jgi:glycosyltransferase involved in cell wall biosynthesis
MKYSIALVIEQYFDPLAGGVQQSTSKLASVFKNNGNKVIIVSVKGNVKARQLWNSIHVFYTGRDQAKELSVLFHEHNISIVLNQSGFNIKLTQILKSALPQAVVLINTLRFNPLAFIENHEVTIRKYFEEKNISFLYNGATSRLILKYHFYRQNYWYLSLLKMVDTLVLLSASYRKEIYQLSPRAELYDGKVVTIPNLFPFSEFKIPYSGKDKIILYVGRLNISEKRVDILMNLWKKLHPILSDWVFWVIGYGPEEEYMKNFCRKYGLTRVKFFGKDMPDAYYEKSSILHFTSASEGFPNVLVESQRYGCVPVLFNSYSAAKDIIDDGRNGFLIKSFNEVDFFNKTIQLTQNQGMLNKMANESILNSNRFSFENVYKLWERLFNDLVSVRN